MAAYVLEYTAKQIEQAHSELPQRLQQFLVDTHVQPKGQEVLTTLLDSLIGSPDKHYSSVVMLPGTGDAVHVYKCKVKKKLRTYAVGIRTLTDDEAATMMFGV